MAFSENFVWGAASSAYQTEGAWDADGKGRSVWDDFSHLKGRIANSENGDIACDAYHRYSEDVGILKQMDLRAYRFSFSWPRILPEGRGPVNKKGLAHYDALVDLLLSSGITPYATLFHWDLPSGLQKEGGWLSRGAAEAFGEFSQVIAGHFKGRIENYITLNEPQCVIDLGYARGLHAPGLRLSPDELLASARNMLLAHGYSVAALREENSPSTKIGVASTGKLCYPAEDTEESIKAAEEASFALKSSDWMFSHNWFLDPAVHGSYPENAPGLLKRFWDSVPERDRKIINSEIDFLGANIYNGLPIDGFGKAVRFPPKYPRTAMGWPVTPQVMRFGPAWLYKRYGLPIYITENGTACSDRVLPDGCAHDPDRISYLREYLTELKQAVSEGIPVLGYFYWSLTDNFEWTEGYSKRFGLVYVDYKTQRRIPKDSASLYAKIIRENGSGL